MLFLQLKSELERLAKTVQSSNLENSTDEFVEDFNKKDNLSTFVLHSGGAYGADTLWDQIGREYGLVNVKHYRNSDNVKLSKTLDNAGVTATVLSNEQLEHARQEVYKILGKKYDNTIQGNLQVRNFYQVNNSDAVYAVAKLNDQMNGVSGGTNTAVQLGIALNKPVYVFDIFKNKWYVYNNERKTFVTTQTPTLTTNFAGVGTRDIQSYSIMRNGSWITRPQTLSEDLINNAKQAIRDVYQKTAQLVDNKNNLSEGGIDSIQMSDEDLKEAEQIRKQCKGE